MTRRIAVTGAAGFLGRTLSDRIDREENFAAVRIVRADFEHGGLAGKLTGCEAVVHLAGESRSEEMDALYRTNMRLSSLVADAVRRTPSVRRLLFGSTTHEAKESLYHASKRDGRALFDAVGAELGIESVGVLMPNAFGPGGKPFYNSVVSTFCRLRADGKPLIVNPGAGRVRLISADRLAEQLLELASGPFRGNSVTVADEFEVDVSEIARLLELFRPDTAPEGGFERKLWECFRSYLLEV